MHRAAKYIVSDCAWDKCNVGLDGISRFIGKVCFSQEARLIFLGLVGVVILWDEKNNNYNYN